MGMFLNSIIPYERYKNISKTRFFVDKTPLIDEIISAVTMDGQQYLCITRPRRFGKSVMANMIGAFFGKVFDGKDIFNTLKISESENYKKHINQHNIIYIDFSEIPEKCSSYDEYISRFLDGLKKDLHDAYPQIVTDSHKAVWDILTEIFQKTMHRFIFIIDEWDAPFHMPFISNEDHQKFLIFLKALFKDKVYVEFVYMTGVLPIAKYSSGSELNMFLEYDMAMSERFSEYFGFSDLEVDTLYKIYDKSVKKAKITREDLRIWYNGYHTAAGERLYNPRSIVSSLADNQLKSYWTSSGPYDEIFYYIRNNIEAIRDDLVLMISGEGVKAEIQNYAAASMQLNTKNEIYSAMVVYGLLTYDDETGEVFIPNQEIMNQFKKLLMSKDSLGYVYRLANESEKMLKATLRGDTKTMAEILKFAHDTESPIFSYNSEIELSAVVNLVYLAARNEYRVEREDKAGKGFVDFIFYPERRNADAFLLELKIDSTPEEAIEQIKQKDYTLCFKGKLGEKEKYTGNILAVGISYNRKTKEHSCKVELL
ncbi:AAA family ATPase [Anaerosporobacter sp.]|uniref:AAA family ATPase n=1 Tax=Anaerosporobacter sp. TaxID=1872529 RepID=UPI00286EFF67|nr:AAA family ATPase [Anaerosporobacter sp.]